MIEWIDDFPDTIWRCHHKKDIITWLKKQNPTWSENDKNLLNRLIGVLDGTNKEDYHKAWEERFLPWLKSLKERIQPQPKQSEHLENYDAAEKERVDFVGD